MPEVSNRKLPALQVRAAFTPSTLNEEARTVEMVFGTDTPVRMYDWDMGSYMESMSFDEGHVRWDRINKGAPLLNNHRSYEGVTGVLGVVERAWAEGGQGKCIVRFSKREDVEPIFQDVKDGILTGVSFGYRVYKYEKTESEEGELPKLRAVDWEPYEVSLAPIQADHNASVREKNQEELQEVEIIDLTLQSQRDENQQPETKTRTMTEEEKAAKAAEDKQRKLDAENAAKEAATAAVKAERVRSTTIIELCRKHGLDEAFRDELIGNDTVTIEKARELVLEKIAEKASTDGIRSVGAVTVGADEKDKFRTAATESLLIRSGQMKRSDAKHGGTDFAGMNLLRMAEEVVVRNGESANALSARELASRALSTSDFPIILGATVNKTLQAEYEGVERTFQPFCRRTTISDLKTKTVGKLSGLMGNLEAIPEGSEYVSDKMTEDKEAYGLVKYGKKVPITMESIINDDLDAFSRLPRAIAYEVGYKQSDIVYGILSANAAMNDGVALFHGDHGNLGTTGVISATTLKEMRKLMRQQTGLNGKFINVKPSYLIVGPEQEELAIQFMNENFYPSTVGTTNTFKGSMEVIVEPRILGDKWYAASMPSNVDTIEYAFLEGEGEFYTETKQGFDIDGMEVKVRMFFAAKAIDHRGLYYNQGS